MSNTRTVKVKIERTRVEYADVDVLIDTAEYDDWRGATADTPKVVQEFIEAHVDFPENLPEPTHPARWTDVFGDLAIVSVLDDVEAVTR